jgi:hypothetical protein
MFAAKEIFVGNAELINLAPCYLSELLFIIVIPLFPYRTMMGRSIFYYKYLQELHLISQIQTH